MKPTFIIAVFALAAALAAPTALAQTTPAPVTAPSTAPHTDDVGADGLKHRGGGTVDDDKTASGKAETETAGDRGHRGGRDKAAAVAARSPVADKSGRDVSQVKDQARGRERAETERAGHDAAGHETGVEHGGGGDHGGHGRGGRG